jgi:thiol-disulfide isomerase/thioredoxin
MPRNLKYTIRALTVLLVLCGAALLVLALRPRVENSPPAPLAAAPDQSAGGLALGQFTPATDKLPAPAVAFTTRDGAAKQLADFKGRFVLVNLWATWCIPCVQEMPALDRLQEKLGDKLTVLAISEDRQGDTAVAPFLDKNRIEHLAIYLDPKSTATNAFAVQGLPTTYLIAPDGTILGKEEGGAAWDQPAMLATLGKYIGQ